MKKLHVNTRKIAHLLSDEQFRDGTTIGDQLNISRTSVWKVIKKLEAYGVAIESIKGKGYALQEPLELLDQVKIKRLIAHKAIQLEVFEQIDSTNTYLAQQLNSNKIKVCLSEMQTQGQGRLARQWHSPFGQNVYLSLQYPFQKDISELSGLSLVVSLAICSALKKSRLLPQEAKVKWPNDIYCEDKKLSGALIQVQAEAHGECVATMGVGMNVNMTQATKQQVNKAWTSIQKLSGQCVDRNVLVAQFIDELIAYLDKYEQQGFNAFQAEWKQHDYLAGKTITLKIGNQNIKGVVKGINAQGHIILKFSNGKEMAYASGDASISTF